MNTFSDETLMAFADDALDPATHAAVDAARREDPEIERRIARHRVLRSRVRLAYSADATQRSTGPAPIATAPTPVPARRAPAPVLDLSQARRAGEARKPPQSPARADGDGVRPRWRALVPIAASLSLGVALGYFTLHRSDPVIAQDGGGMYAVGVLGRELSSGLTGETGMPVRIDLSFVSKSDAYCRVFTLIGAAASSGIACRQGEKWRVSYLAEATVSSAADVVHGGGREIYAAPAPVVLAAAKMRMVGAPLDVEAEKRARQRSWRSER